MGRNDEVFSKRVRAGKRTYFFDVKATKSGEDFFLVITESKRVSAPDGNGVEQFEKHHIWLYKEDFEKFRDGLDEALDAAMKQLQGVAD